MMIIRSFLLICFAVSIFSLSACNTFKEGNKEDHTSTDPIVPMGTINSEPIPKRSIIEEGEDYRTG